MPIQCPNGSYFLSFFLVPLANGLGWVDIPFIGLGTAGMAFWKLVGLMLLFGTVDITGFDCFGVPSQSYQPFGLDGCVISFARPPTPLPRDWKLGA